MSYELLSDIIFINDTTFANIDIQKARMLMCVCKTARHNKNIQMSFIKDTANKYCMRIKAITKKKVWKEMGIKTADEMMGAYDLNITDDYRAQAKDTICDILREDEIIITLVRLKMSIEQEKNIDTIIKYLKNIISVILRLGFNLNNITDETRDICENDEEYVIEKYNRVELIARFKYNAYIINTLFNNGISEDTIINYISSEFFDDNLYILPIIFTKSLADGYDSILS
jgi:hypothetical protein